MWLLRCSHFYCAVARELLGGFLCISTLFTLFWCSGCQDTAVQMLRYSKWFLIAMWLLGHCYVASIVSLLHSTHSSVQE